MQPLSSEIDTFKTATARLWPWLELMSDECFLSRVSRSFPDRSRLLHTLRPYPEYCRANFYPWSSFPSRRARPGPGPHTHRRHCSASPQVQGYLAHKKRRPPQDHHRILGIGLLKGPTGGLFLMSEVPLYPAGFVTCSRCSPCLAL